MAPSGPKRPSLSDRSPSLLRIRVKLLRDVGAALSPFNAFQLIQGLETLPLRIRQHVANAEKVADHLANHPSVTRVIYPKLQDGEFRRRADTYLEGGYGALVGFELKGGVEAGRKFIDALKLLYHVANIGDARSLAIHPASTTHSQLTAEEQLKTGVTPGYVRLSIGIEHPDDIIADLDQALAAASETVAAAASDRFSRRAGRRWGSWRRLFAALHEIVAFHSVRLIRECLQRAVSAKRLEECHADLSSARHSGIRNHAAFGLSSPS